MITKQFHEKKIGIIACLKEAKQVIWKLGPKHVVIFKFQYGEEYDAASDRPISVLKEHTMFTDTHL